MEERVRLVGFIVRFPNQTIPKPEKRVFFGDGIGGLNVEKTLWPGHLLGAVVVLNNERPSNIGNSRIRELRY